MIKPIRKLAPHIAERIAAGEMIERPSSVVKELVENSLDAGCTEVSVVLEDGGKSLIEVTDNGNGMLPEDLDLCVERHATSKLSELEDLEKISTLGFRGEALPSIAAVSDLGILSRSRESASTYELRLGDISTRLYRNENTPRPEKTAFGNFLGSPHGTRIRAQGLFSQIPARLKFLKSQGAEVSQVREWMERLALAHPSVGFRLASDDRVLLNLRPQTELERVKAILSSDESFPIVTASHEQDGFRDLGFQAQIFWLHGTSSPNSKNLIQVVNQRAIRDRMLQQAMLAPFRQVLLPGQFPALALIIRINPAAIDVNVHPTKTEIRFLDSRKVFHSIDKLVRELIAKQGAPALVSMAPDFAPNRAYWQEQAQKRSSGSDSELGGTKGLLVDPKSGDTSTSFGSVPLGDARESRPSQFHSESRHAPQPPYFGPQSNLWSASESQVRFPPEFYSPQSTGSTDSNGLEAQQARPSMGSSPNGSALSPNPLEAARFAGSIFNTYLMYERGSELLLIDQHAAHERIRYEKLRKRFLPRDKAQPTSPTSATPALDTETNFQGSSSVPNSQVLSSQALLIPEVVKISEISLEDRTALLKRMEWLSQFGFEAEVFGEDTLLFRSVPVEWGTRGLKVRLKNLVDRILADNSDANTGNGPSNGAFSGEALFDESLFEALASEACHSAVRAGDLLEKEEIQNLVTELFQCEHPWNCPHGRPTLVKVPLGKLEEWFQRKV